MGQKLHPDITYSDKILKLFMRMFFSPGPRSLTDLARDLGCSKQGVSRIVKQIEAGYGVPIERYKRANQLYYVFDSPKKYPPQAMLSATELNMLQMCRAFTENLMGVKQFGEAMRAIEKSTKMLPVDVKLPKGNFGVLRFGSIDYSPFQQQLETLIEAMESKKVCEISYKRVLDKKPYTFRIKPMKIFSHRESIYIHAIYAKMPNQVFKPADYNPLLALHRVKKATITSTGFKTPANYNFERAMNRSFGVMRGKKFKVKASFTGWAAGYVQERVWSKDQKIVKQRSGAIRLEFSATSETEVLNWILSFANEGTLLGPKPLVTKLKQQLADVSKLYQ